MEAYQNALAHPGIASSTEIGSSRTKSGTIDAAIAAYYKSDAFTESLAAETQRMRRNVLERFRSQHGDKPVRLLRQDHIAKLLQGMKPYAKKNWLKTIRGLMVFAVRDRP